jgi:hypothetical protein
MIRTSSAFCIVSKKAIEDRGIELYWIKLTFAMFPVGELEGPRLHEARGWCGFCDILGTRLYQNLSENGCGNQQRQEKKFKADL